MLSTASVVLLANAFYLMIVPVTAAPAQPDWSSLNQTIRGHLRTATPFALPCFSQYNDHSTQLQAAACREVQANYTSPYYRTDHFSAYMNTQDEICAPDPSQQCLLDPTAPTSSKTYSGTSCNQGAVPPYYIEVESANDIQAAFSFASSSHTPISIKNSGHDYNGRSSGPGSLALWTRGLQNLTYHTSFVPSGCTQQSGPAAITTGAGANFDQVYAFANHNNATFVGGSGPTVGASGGWVLTAGHGILSRAYGLGIDRVLEFQIVTPDGAYRTANACQNQDLFWALRGGGGSTFGVVMSTTHRVEPTMPLSIAFVTMPRTSPASVQSGFLDLLINNTLKWAREGWGGFQSSTVIFFATPLLSVDDAKSSMADVLAYASTYNGTVIIESLPNWYALYTKYVIPFAQPVGSSSFANNRLISSNLFASADGRKQIRTHMDWMSSVGLAPQVLATTPYLYSGNGSAKAQAYAYGNMDSTSSTPAWRSSAILLESAATWSYDSSLAEKKKLVALLTEESDRASRLSPEGGSYANEAQPWTKDWEKAFWGGNYEKLVGLKGKWDPEGLLGCWHCVGSRGDETVGGKCLGSFGS